MKFLKELLYSFTIILTIAYIVFRIGFTLPVTIGPVAVIFSVIVLLLEIWDAIDFTVYYMNILGVDRKNKALPKIKDEDYPDVDVFVATINENEKVLATTIEACKNMKYPDKKKVHIYICDDGNRKNIKELTEKLEVNYITRLSNKDAKAGNYNNALKKTKSPYIATFDADMIPTEDFLMKTIPYFLGEDKKVGFVQLPQSFKNPDIFQLRFKLADKIPFEQDYFYRQIQLSKNDINTAINCGTNLVLSREALNSIDGFARNTITEDIATGMLMENAGYTGIAIDEVGAHGNNVNDVTSFIKQRSRWARGCIQVAKNYKISKQRGLSFRQKLEYKSCISYWFYGIRRMLYMLAPLLFTVFGVIIIDCDLRIFLAVWLPAYLIKRFLIDLTEGHHRSSTWNKIYETILTPVLCKEVLKELLGFGSTKFEVTPKYSVNKKMTRTHKKLFVSHFILLAISIAALVYSIIRGQGAFYFDSYFNSMTFNLSLIWLASNIFYLTCAVIFDLSNRTKIPEDFVPNKLEKYKRSSIPFIFINIFRRDKKEAKETK